ncbi:hypothetical protein NQZ68_033842 [Dissostichus eleginoides]|nr:hypothetical protein NQZ68_033842 [Dissostichus eleginoides]
MDLALIEEIDPEAAISGPEEEEDREDISPAVDPEAAISGPEGEDKADSRRPRLLRVTIIEVTDECLVHNETALAPPVPVMALILLGLMKSETRDPM